MTDAVHALLTILDVQPSIGVGHSAGVAVLLQLALTHERAPASIVGVNSALVSINALGQVLQPFSRAMFDLDFVTDAVASLLRGGLLATTLLRSTGTVLDPAQEARYVSMLTDETRVKATLRMMSRWDLPTLGANLSRIVQPVTLVHSANEPWVPFAELLDVTRDLRARTVVDLAPAGHLIPDEKPARLAEIIAAVFAGMSAAPAG
jgi:magnesium chelatase accessory protein